MTRLRHGTSTQSVATEAQVWRANVGRLPQGWGRSTKVDDLENPLDVDEEVAAEHGFNDE